MGTVTGRAPAQIAESLASIVGPEHTRVESETIVAAPANESEISTVLRFCQAEQLVVTPVGGGTKCGWGNPVRARVELSLARLKTVREHAWQDMTCSVEAGCTWSALESKLQEHGQMVALDPLWPSTATVGGIVAVNDSGTLRLKYGSLRDLIIGMTVVLPDGTVAKSGGKVVKNVAGYDLHKLMTGSFGTLGVIASVNFRLHPFEKCTRTWTVRASSPESFATSLAALLDSQITPSSVQLRVSKGTSHLDVRVAAPPDCFGEHEALLKRIFGALAWSDSAEDVWQSRQNLFADPASLVFKFSVPPSQLCIICKEMLQGAKADGINLEIVAQATGLATVAIHLADVRVIDWIGRMRTKAGNSGGSVVALQVPASLRGDIDVWGPVSSAIHLMRAIKQRFDPACILNPGRFLGNI